MIRAVYTPSGHLSMRVNAVEGQHIPPMRHLFATHHRGARGSKKNFDGVR